MCIKGFALGCFTEALLKAIQHCYVINNGPPERISDRSGPLARQLVRHHTSWLYLFQAHDPARVRRLSRARLAGRIHVFMLTQAENLTW
jgi:hypothetical protein